MHSNHGNFVVSLQGVVNFSTIPILHDRCAQGLTRTAVCTSCSSCFSNFVYAFTNFVYVFTKKWIDVLTRWLEHNDMFICHVQCVFTHIMSHFVFLSTFSSMMFWLQFLYTDTKIDTYTLVNFLTDLGVWINSSSSDSLY